MYDWPEIQSATDAIWSCIAERLRAIGIAAPDRLERSRPRAELWTDPALVLSQTCAWPFVTRLRERVALVGTPIYDVEGCAGPLYSSFLIARADEPGDSLAAFRGARFAVNGRDSLSGYIALRHAMSAENLGAAEVVWVETGSHRASIRAVAEGSAEIAAIDAVCWALAGRHEGNAAERLRIVNRTPLRPGLPLITSGSRSAEEVTAIRDAVATALASPASLPARQALFLAGIEQLEESEYAALAVLDPDRPHAPDESRASRG